METKTEMKLLSTALRDKTLMMTCSAEQRTSVNIYTMLWCQFLALAAEALCLTT